MTKLKPAYFLVPALFLLCLGVGNIIVGTFKARQYQQVFDELIVLSPPPEPEFNSTLSRLEAVHKTSDRRLQRQMEADERRNLYQLVAFGGKVIVVIGLSLFCIGTIIRYAQSLEERNLRINSQDG